MDKKFLLFTLILVLITSCSLGGVNIDNIIKEYDNADFSPLHNMCVSYRSRGNESNTSLYYISGADGWKTGPYSVTVNNKDKSILNIGNSLVQYDEPGVEYLTQEEILNAIKCYLQYPFFLIKVDKDGNVYISPIEQDRPTIMRKAPNSSPDDLNQYKQYKNHWYIRK